MVIFIAYILIDKINVFKMKDYFIEEAIEIINFYDESFIHDTKHLMLGISRESEILA